MNFLYTRIHYHMRLILLAQLILLLGNSRAFGQISPQMHVTITGPNTVCVGEPVVFTCHWQDDEGTCTEWDWSNSDGDTLYLQGEYATISWNSPGSYHVDVVARCKADIANTLKDYQATYAVTVVAPLANQSITPATGENFTHPALGSAVICPQSSLILVPPTGATNCQWSTDYLFVVPGGTTDNGLTLLSNGRVKVKPTFLVHNDDDDKYYLNYNKIICKLTYSLPNTAPCQTPPLFFTVNIGSVGGLADVGDAERFGPGSVAFVIKNYTSDYIYSWYETNNSTTPLVLAAVVTPGTPTECTFTSPSLTQSRSYYLVVTSCKDGDRQEVHALLRKVRLTVDGIAPAKPLALRYGTGLTLQADPATVGPYTWFLNGEVITGETSSQLTVYTPGSYTVRMAGGTGPEYMSAPVEVLDALAGQLANQQPLTYSSELVVLKPNVIDPAQLVRLGATERRQTVTYANSLGQPIQQVAVQAGPDQQDIVQHLSYEGSSTSAQTFLPFPVAMSSKVVGEYEPAPATKQLAYYAAQDSQPFSFTTTEASPLGRPLEQTQTGQGWAGHSARLSYGGNSASEVRRWQGFDGTQFYAEGQLTKETSLDPDNRRTEIYKDQLGRVVLQRKVLGNGSTAENFDTYTVYADAGYVQLVIPPAAVKALATSGQWLIQDAGFKDRWLYQYSYDDLGRVIERKFPGAQAVYIVYDKFDRPVLVQDGSHRTNAQWLFTKFDAQNRVVVEGVWPDRRSRQEVQLAADQFAQNQTLDYEARSAASYTTSNTFPVVEDGTSGTLLSLIFYDNYDLDADGQPDYAYRTVAELSQAEQPVATSQTRGLTTVTRRRVVQSDDAYGDWLTTVLFYDQYGNVIQKQGNNILEPSANLLDVTTLVYRAQGFVPQILRTIKQQAYGASTPVVVRNRFTYDVAGHLLQTWQQNQTLGNLEPEVLLSSNHHTGLGELTQKKLHSLDGGTTFLQYEDFAYNLHGQLVSINKSDLTTNPENDLFGLELVREQAAATGSPRYDGGISAVSWTAHNAAQQHQPERERRYLLTYDGLGRLTAATYAARNFPWESYGREVGAYDEKGITYDGNGNLTAVKRYSQPADNTLPELIDNLYLDYGSATVNGGNRLLGAYDYQNDARGFKNSTTTGWDDYAYDANGNLTHDGNKNIDYQYNILNKAARQVVDQCHLDYDYDAAGTVVRKTTRASKTMTKTEYFIDGFVYEYSPSFAGLRSVPTPEGRAIALQPNAPRLSYEYHLRDHLGNLRVAFRADRQPEQLHLAMEDPSQEEGPYPKFSNVSSSQSSAGISYHGPTVASGSYSAAVTATQPGPSTRMPVAQGDQIKISLWYATPNGVQYPPGPDPGPSHPPLTEAHRPPVWAIAPTLMPAPTTASPETLPSARPAVGVQVSVTGLLAHLFGKALPTSQPTPAQAGFGPVEEYPEPTPNQPRAVAYVALRLFNQQNQLVQQWRQEAPVVQNGSAFMSWNQLRFLVTPDLSAAASRTGYLEVQLLNEGGQPVYFDSLTIRHPKDVALVSQENHYYPFGLPLSGVAVNTVAQPQISKDQFNGGSALQDELLGSEQGIYSTFYRSYDPATGRFQGVDPLADTYADVSPYSFGYNDPINFNDPDGDEPIFVGGRLMNPRDVATGQTTWSGSALDYATYQMGGPGVSVGYGGSNYIGSYREYDPQNGTYNSILVDGKWKSPYYYTTISVYDNSKQSFGGTYSSNTFGLIGAVPAAESVLAWIGLDYSIPDPTDAVVVKHAVYAVAAATAAAVIYKATPKRVGVQYTLRTTRNGFYFTYDWGRKFPTGLSYLPKGAIWKIGETMQWNSSTLTQKRYSQAELAAWDVKFVPEFEGNKGEIFLVEQQKLLLYLYENGELPQGNKGFK